MSTSISNLLSEARRKIDTTISEEKKSFFSKIFKKKESTNNDILLQKFKSIEEIAMQIDEGKQTKVKDKITEDLRKIIVALNNPNVKQKQKISNVNSVLDQLVGDYSKYKEERQQQQLCFKKENERLTSDKLEVPKDMPSRIDKTTMPKKLVTLYTHKSPNKEDGQESLVIDYSEDTNRYYVNGKLAIENPRQIKNIDEKVRYIQSKLNSPGNIRFIFNPDNEIHTKILKECNPYLIGLIAKYDLDLACDFVNDEAEKYIEETEKRKSFLKKLPGVGAIALAVGLAIGGNGLLNSKADKMDNFSPNKNGYTDSLEPGIEKETSNVMVANQLGNKEKTTPIAQVTTKETLRETLQMYGTTGAETNKSVRTTTATKNSNRETITTNPITHTEAKVMFTTLNTTKDNNTRTTKTVNSTTRQTTQSTVASSMAKITTQSTVASSRANTTTQSKAVSSTSNQTTSSVAQTTKPTTTKPNNTIKPETNIVINIGDKIEVADKQEYSATAIITGNETIYRMGETCREAGEYTVDRVAFCYDGNILGIMNKGDKNVKLKLKQYAIRYGIEESKIDTRVLLSKVSGIGDTGWSSISIEDMEKNIVKQDKNQNLNFSRNENVRVDFER